MKNEKNTYVSPFGFVASLVTIFAFITGIHSLPSLLMDGTHETLSEVGNIGLSYGVLIISQATFFFCYFLVCCSFFHKKILIGLLGFDAISIELFCKAIFIVFGFGLSFLFAEVFWGPVINWDLKSGPGIQFAFLVVSFFAHLFTAWCVVDWYY